MRSNSGTPELQNLEKKPEVLAKPAVRDHRQEIDRWSQKGGCEPFDDDDFVAMSDTLPEMGIIFENEYTM